MSCELPCGSWAQIQDPQQKLSTAEPSLELLFLAFGDRLSFCNRSWPRTHGDLFTSALKCWNYKPLCPCSQCSSVSIVSVSQTNSSDRVCLSWAPCLQGSPLGDLTCLSFSCPPALLSVWTQGQPVPNYASVPSAMTCPANTVYQRCMTPCPASCAKFVTPKVCEGPCVEGCASLPGYIYSDTKSLPVTHCGCTTDGVYYKVRVA